MGGEQDLTQTVWGFSRDDAVRFIGRYSEQVGAKGVEWTSNEDAFPVSAWAFGVWSMGNAERCKPLRVSVDTSMTRYLMIACRRTECDGVEV